MEGRWWYVWQTTGSFPFISLQSLKERERERKEHPKQPSFPVILSVTSYNQWSSWREIEPLWLPCRAYNQSERVCLDELDIQLTQMTLLELIRAGELGEMKRLARIWWKPRSWAAIDMKIMMMPWSGEKSVTHRQLAQLIPPGGQEARACRFYLGSIPELGRSPGEGHDNPFQYSCLENPMDRGVLWAMVHGFVKSWIWQSDLVGMQQAGTLSCLAAN